MKTNWTLVPALPSIPEPDWNIWFNKLENPVYEIPCKLTPTEKVLLGMTEGEWLIVFHFVIKKKWLKKHKIPIKPKEAKIFEPKGTYWYWLLELCIQLHITQWGHAYDNAGHWFFCLANERRGSNLKGFDSIFQYYTTEKSQDLENQKDLNQKWLGKKNHVIDVEQHIIGELRKSQNPVHPDYYPHHYRLMEAALKMKDFSNNFRADFWRPFLNSYSQWIKSLRSSFSSCAAVEQKILVQEGRGKYTIPLDLPDYLEYKRPLFFVLPEALPDKPFNG